MANRWAAKKKIFDTPNNSRLDGQPAYRIRWDNVPYEPGVLKVVAYKNGKVWATDSVRRGRSPRAPAPT